MAERPTQVRQLHPVLGLGSTLTAAAFVLLTYLGIAPLLGNDATQATVIVYALCGASVAAALVALLFFRSKIPTRTLGQTDDEFWSTPPMPDPALLVWFLLEGAAVLSAVAFVLTGHQLALVLMPVMLLLYWLQPPGALGKG